MNRIEKQRIKRAERKKWCLEYLGDKCVVCSTISDLEFDHIDGATKKYTISTHYTSSIRVLKEELDKCQLLCGKHHDDKTLREKGMIRAKGTHGTLASYRYCHCDKCKEANNIYNRMYHGWGKKIPPEHGSYAKYKRGCKCEECKKANTTYMKNFYAKRALLT